MGILKFDVCRLFIAQKGLYFYFIRNNKDGVYDSKGMDLSSLVYFLLFKLRSFRQDHAAYVRMLQKREFDLREKPYFNENELIDLANVGYAKYTDNAYKPTLSTEQQAAADAQKLVDTSKAQPGTQLANAGTGTMTDAGNQLGEIRVTAGREAGAVENVLPYTSTTVTKPSSKPAGTLPAVKVTAQREPGAPENVLPFTETDSLPEVKVTGQREIVEENQPVAEKPAKEAPAKTVYPSMYFTGVAPTSGSPLAQGLNLSSGAPLPTTGLTSSRGAGEIESKESGKKRSTVWNEESLRLKDALGV